MDVHLPLMRELCPFDLAPVTSTAIQMLFGDTCAVAIMQVFKLYWINSWSRANISWLLVW
jgi:arabinose-5-phosphate isomerase